LSIRSAFGVLAALFLFGTAQAAAAPAPRILPTDDLYLPTSEVLPPGVVPDPIHDLDTVRATWWGDMPKSLVQRVLGDSPAQRVVFQDTLTGAEVWLICRSPGDEFEGFYSALGNFNADGSMLEIDRFVMTVLGANPRPLSRLVDRNRDRTAVRDFNWDAKDPATGLCQRFSGAIQRFNFRSGEETPLFDPGRRFPRDCMLLITDDGRHMLVARQKNEAHPFLYLTDAAGEILREIELRSRSSDPAMDHMGGLQLYRRILLHLFLEQGGGANHESAPAMAGRAGRIDLRGPREGHRQPVRRLPDQRQTACADTGGGGSDDIGIGTCRTFAVGTLSGRQRRHPYQPDRSADPRAAAPGQGPEFRSLRLVGPG
jgi:hypothetical protein